MQIGCTKKLLDYLGCEVQVMDTAAPSIFNFTANIITVARRKCIAVVHNESRCGFVIYGVTAKNNGALSAFILQGIERMLRKERFCDEIISRFLADCGKAVFTKTADRVCVSRINKFCEWVMIYSPQFIGDSTFQEHLLPKLNGDLVKLGGDYEYAFKKLALLLETYYEAPPFRYRAAVLDVDLILSDGVCNRRIVVPLYISLFHLHIMIQTVFEWKNCHLHSFVLNVAADGTVLERAALFGEDDIYGAPGVRMHDELRMNLWEVFAKRKAILYEYDYGDGWLHRITLVREIEDCTLPAPVCERADVKAPPEDCGGPEGFADLKKILGDPSNEEYRNAVEWYGYTELRNKGIRMINFDLQDAIRIFPEDWVEEYDG